MIGYPTKVNHANNLEEKTKSLSHIGRGMSLENDINDVEKEVVR